MDYSTSELFIIVPVADSPLLTGCLWLTDAEYGGQSDGPDYARPGAPSFVPGFPELMLMGNIPTAAYSEGIGAM